MSIIGEMYEEEIWDSNKKLQDKCKDFIVFLNQMSTFKEEGYLVIYQITDEFKKRFEQELKGNDR